MNFDMCRLFGQLSVAPRAAKDLLVDSPRSLLKQSNARPKDAQKDGWGLGWFDPGARVVKSPKPVFDERGRFASAAARAKSRAVIGHLRAASNPRGVPMKKLLNLANTQPFTDGKWVFCHNGTLQIPDEVTRFLGPYRSKVKSLNDSEVFFWQLRKFIDAKRGDVAEALKACVRETWGLWEANKAKHKKKESPYTGLNALVSDGKSLHALCLYKSKPGHVGLMTRQPWGNMSLTRRPGRVVISSENMDGGRWDRLAVAEVVSAVVRGKRIEVRRERFDPRELS